MGTFGWSMRGAPDPREGDYKFGKEGGDPPRGGHFDPRNFSSLGPSVAVEVRRQGDSLVDASMPHACKDYTLPRCRFARRCSSSLSVIIGWWRPISHGGTLLPRPSLPIACDTPREAGSDGDSLECWYDTPPELQGSIASHGRIQIPQAVVELGSDDDPAKYKRIISIILFPGCPNSH